LWTAYYKQDDELLYSPCFKGGAGRIQPVSRAVLGELCAFYFLFQPVSRVVPGEINQFQGQCRANSAHFIFYFTQYRANFEGSRVVKLELTFPS
jgi:hypothetical protein